MKCKKVQDRLITEYVDKELGPEETAKVQQHLTACPDCLEFLGAVQKSAVVPFKEAGTLEPESVVWQRIQEKIEAEQAPSHGGFWRLVDIFVSRFPIPVPVMRAAFVTALILGVVVLAKWPSSYTDPAYGYLSEQMTFMSGLKAGDTDLLNGDFKSYETVLEGISG
ncbi:MAG: anti-sigma factor [Candidatus Omnitrophota bacterium]